MSVAELGSTGCEETSAFHGLSAGKTRRAPSGGPDAVSRPAGGGSVSEESAPPHAQSASSVSEPARRQVARIAGGSRALERRQLTGRRGYPAAHDTRLETRHRPS